MNLNDVNRGIQKHKKRKRIGRGPGSGHGKMSGKGEKGQRSRAGFSQHITFQGGAMPLVRRIPKRGFNNRYALEIKTLNVMDLENLFEAGAEVTPDTLKAKSLAKGRYDELKILGNGELTKALTVSAHRFSATAKAKIEQAGGSVVVLPPRVPVQDKQDEARAAKGLPPKRSKKQREREAKAAEQASAASEAAQTNSEGEA